MVVEILCGEVGRTGASAPTNLLVLEMPRLPYVKYSTGANETTRTAYRALGKPDWTAARSAFLAERTISEWHAEAKCFFRRVSAISYPSASFLPILFWQDRKEWAVGDNLRLRRIRNGPTAQERMGLRRKKACIRRVK